QLLLAEFEGHRVIPGRGLRRAARTVPEDQSVDLLRRLELEVAGDQVHALLQDELLLLVGGRGIALVYDLAVEVADRQLAALGHGRFAAAEQHADLDRAGRVAAEPRARFRAAAAAEHQRIGREQMQRRSAQRRLELAQVLEVREHPERT